MREDVEKVLPEEIIEKMNLAKTILESDENLGSRSLIDNLFAMTSIKADSDTEATRIDKIQMRLSVIDSFYSTNMGRRLYGLKELAEKISELGDDEKLREKLNLYINQGDSDISGVFTKKYGIFKHGIPSADNLAIESNVENDDEGFKAISLISKYFYFVSNHNFPIYDSLVRNNIKKVLNHFHIKNHFTGKLIEEEFIRELVRVCDKDKFAEFDNLLWLYGKIQRGSLSFLADKKIYINIMELLRKRFLDNLSKYADENGIDLEVIPKEDSLKAEFTESLKNAAKSFKLTLDKDKKIFKNDGEITKEKLVETIFKNATSDNLDIFVASQLKDDEIIEQLKKKQFISDDLYTFLKFCREVK
ncbi:MAG: hypothetical protein IJ207_07345 [Treponema sp.]|uniref:hypothetical protein n=1 Tax=Treponema sp. TaxID=166 RepID=UPI0025D344D9|nr:hypothetical protein [Treponema sp.]MBQ9282000.1 hypothetical protein [Treponema sp.]MBR1721126.1 hypothetical protein [Treponema sp.]